MPRHIRQKGESGIYHVMARGISQAQLFYDSDDRVAFLERLSRFKKECSFSLLAWCLMGNHVHLLIKEGSVALPILMKKIELSYSHYFNAKYDRKGYLFQDRYKSKPVEADEYLISVVRYIHRNPLEAGLPITSWTSYNEYLRTPDLADTSILLDTLSEHREEARRSFKNLVNEGESTEEVFWCDEHPGRVSDSAATELILEVSNLTHCPDVCRLEKRERNRVVADLRKRGL